MVAAQVKQPQDGRNSRLFANNARQLWLIVFVIVSTLIFIFGLSAVVIELIIMKRNPDLNEDKKFKELDVTYEDISEEVVPYVQRWFRGLHLGTGSGKQHLIPTVFQKRTQNDEADLSCLEAWFSDMMEHLDGFTSPPYMETILDNMGLRHSVLIRKILNDYLHAPQPLIPLYNTSQSCLGNMNGVPELACKLRKAGALWDLGGDVSHQNYATYSVNMAVIVEVLTRELQNNPPALHEVIDVMNHEGYRRRQDYVYGTNLDRAAREFLLQKYEGIALSLELLGKEMAIGKRIQNGVLGLQMNILEAVKLDAFVGHDLNARVGLALATRVQYDKNDDLNWGLGKEWIDSYMTWNMVFVMGHLPLRSLGNLLIPSVVCEADSMDHGKDWWIPRLLSLALALIGCPGETVGVGVGLPEGVIRDIVETETLLSLSDEFMARRWPIARGLGQINFATAEITPPSANSVERMLFKLCGGVCHDNPFAASGTVPHEKMDDEQFQVYTGFVAWITVLLAGLGCEVFVWYHFLQVWDENREGLWRFAQFLFPLMSMIALGLAFYHDFLSLAFVVTGFWKFGFPETLMYLYLGLFSEVSSRAKRITDLLDGVGTVAHHSSAALMISMLLSGAIPPSPHVANPSFVLIMQHWFCLLVYVNQWLYMGVELFLEFWFEWLIMSEFGNLYNLHWVAAQVASVMLFAHWLYLLGAGLRLLVTSDDSVEKEHNVHMRGSKEASQRKLIAPSGPEGSATSSHHGQGSAFSSLPARRKSSSRSWQLAAAFCEEKIAAEEEKERRDASSSDIEVLFQSDNTSLWHATEHSDENDEFHVEPHESRKGNSKKEPREKLSSVSV